MSKSSATTTPPSRASAVGIDSTICNSTTLSHFIQTIAIYENERCWLGRGFTAGGLLPNDRGRYTTLDGSKSWNTLQEASRDLLGACSSSDGCSNPTTTNESTFWKWRQEDYEATANEIERKANDEATNQLEENDSISPHCMGEWMYAHDFTLPSIRHAKPKRSALHWVRFRIFQREAIFVIPQELQTTAHTTTAKGCHNCDSKAVRSLAQVLLEVYTFAAMAHDGIMTTANAAENPSHQFKEATLLSIKIRLVHFLVKSTTESGQNEEEDGQDAFYKLDRLHQSLQKFADQELQESKASHLFKSILSLSSPSTPSLPSFSERKQIPHFLQFCHHLGGMPSGKTSVSFSEDERNAIAFCCIKSLDRYHQLQCDNMLGCKGDTMCDYQWMSCPNANKGCPVIMSRLYLESHNDEECQYKPMTCELCGMGYVRHQQSHHKQAICPMREAPCPFAHLGCSTILKAQDIPQHLEATTSAHLLLALQRMKEYETQISRLHNRLGVVEQQNQQLTGQQQTDAKVMERRLKELQQRLYGVENSTTGEIRRLHDKLRQSERSRKK